MHVYIYDRAVAREVYERTDLLGLREKLLDQAIILLLIMIMMIRLLLIIIIMIIIIIMTMIMIVVLSLLS